MKQKISIQQVDDLLPQTQCGLCGYGACKPYAKAIVEKNEKINLCAPGGVKVLQQLAKLTHQAADPYMKTMLDKATPDQIAYINEDQCIGCTKCLAVCPVDAILGASKQMHTVIESECTGCKRCVAPCPVDCISMIEKKHASDTSTTQKRAHYYRLRFERRNNRLLKAKATLTRKHQQAKLGYQKVANCYQTLAVRKQFIEQAVQRHRKRLQRQETKTTITN